MSYSDRFSNRRVLEVYHIDCIWHYMRGVHVSRQTLVVLREKYTRVKKNPHRSICKSFGIYKSGVFTSILIFFPKGKGGELYFCLIIYTTQVLALIVGVHLSFVNYILFDEEDGGTR